MLTWLRQRPASSRRAARPAMTTPIPFPPVPKEPEIENPTSGYVPEADDELPPPFFDDTEEAFLDLGDTTPPPLPATPVDLEARIANALANLPPFPEASSPDRAARLLQILRTLDRIAGDVCNVLESGPKNEEALPTAAKSR